MIQQRQRDIEYRETANDTRQRLMSDMSRLEAKVERLTDQLATKERELQALTSKEQKAAAAHRAQVERLQHERDEFQRMVISTQQVRIQQVHELKKKEKEFIKLQERLNQVLLEKKKESKTGMEIMNLLQKEGKQRGTWLNKKADGDFYKMIVDAYEAKKQELIAENSDLRNMLRSMQACFPLNPSVFSICPVPIYKLLVFHSLFFWMCLKY
jgi:X breakpoint 2-interacting protein